MTESKRHALVIGCNRYQDETLRQLVAPELDAQALARVLEHPSIGGFKVETSVNQKKYDLGLAIQKFFAHSELEDTLLLYFSGHGVLDAYNSLHLATVKRQLEIHVSDN
jgi:uncharacterized caspase-like protein